MATNQQVAWLVFLGGRKFIALAFVLISATGLRLLTLIDQGTWERVVLAGLAIYGTANVTQKATAKQPVEPPPKIELTSGLGG